MPSDTTEPAQRHEGNSKGDTDDGGGYVDTYPPYVVETPEEIPNYGERTHSDKLVTDSRYLHTGELKPVMAYRYCIPFTFLSIYVIKQLRKPSLDNILNVLLPRGLNALQRIQAMHI